MTTRLPDTLPFNGPIECGLRVLIVLSCAAPDSYDLTRLTVYDYILLHSNDVPQEVLTRMGHSPPAPKSLHPATPYRGGELLVRRKTIRDGIRLMVSKGLVEPEYDSAGISFRSTAAGRPFIQLLESEYVKDLIARAEWLVSLFRQMSGDEIPVFASRYLMDQGGEFFNESLIKRRGK